jgi:peptidoglycan/xylan/chitin deacetylase (PgdA/CDA1 family)
VLFRSRLLREFPSFQMLSWGEIGQLSASGVEIGSHGVDHEIHHSNQEASVRRNELTESKRELEQRLNRPCYSFAYPNGDTMASSPVEARSAGYKLAFTTIQDTVTVGTDPYQVPRLEPAVSMDRLVRDFFWKKDEC